MMNQPEEAKQGETVVKNSGASFGVTEERLDPSMRLSQPIVKNFELGDFLIENSNPHNESVLGKLNPGHDDFCFKTFCKYLIKSEEVSGTIIIRKDCLSFESAQDS